VHELVRGTPPWIDLAVEMQAQKICLQAIAEGLVRSAHDVSEGGLAVALAEACISGPDEPLGAEIEMEATIRPDAWFFGESQSRIVLSVRRKHVNRLRDLARAADVPLTVLGEIRGRRLRIGTLIDVNTADLRRSWAEALSRRMEE
jgi:phosphoribosylformylglycinamidine synthase